MEINRKAILDKTHYGLNIYAYVLRQFYPGETVLSLSGRDCSPAKNPFNEDKPTLMISIVDNCAVHSDNESKIESGDVFDFAERYLKLSGQELFDKLNEVMHLRIGENVWYQNKEVKPKLITPEVEKPKSPVFSFFKKPVRNVFPTQQLNLVEVYQLIKGDKYIQATNALREIKDDKKARKFKADNFDYATFSGVFSRRNDASLEIHSNLLTVDFDHIEDVTELKENLLKDEYFDTELLFISPSGDGLKWIIPIDLSKVNHQEYFKAVSNYIQHTYSLQVDGSGKDVSRACFLPHDPDVFIHPKYL